MNKINILFIVIVSILSCDFSSAEFTQRNINSKFVKDTIIKKQEFSKLRSKYDILIPIMNGLFITYDSFDFSSYNKLIEEVLPKIKKEKVRGSNILHSMHLNIDELGRYSINSKKWGVIDSAGNTVIPFMCDAIRALENGEGVFSIYKESHSLNTGLPRYSYSGYYYFFNRNGIDKKKKGELFKITTVFVADFHRDDFVIENGNTFYLPSKYYLHNKKARGGASDATQYETIQ